MAIENNPTTLEQKEIPGANFVPVLVEPLLPAVVEEQPFPSPLNTQIEPLIQVQVDKPLEKYPKIPNAQLILDKLSNKIDTLPVFSELLLPKEPKANIHELTLPDEKINYREKIQLLCEFLSTDNAIRDNGFHVGSAIGIVNRLFELMDENNMELSREISQIKPIISEILTKIPSDEIFFPTIVELKKLSAFCTSKKIPLEPEAKQQIELNQRYSIPNEQKALGFINSILTGKRYDPEGIRYDYMTSKSIFDSLSWHTLGFQQGKKDSLSFKISSLNMMNECLGHKLVQRDKGIHLTALCAGFNIFFDDVLGDLQNIDDGESKSRLNIAVINQFKEFYTRINSIYQGNTDLKPDIIVTNSIYQMANRLKLFDVGYFGNDPKEGPLTQDFLTSKKNHLMGGISNDIVLNMAIDFVSLEERNSILSKLRSKKAIGHEKDYIDTKVNAIAKDPFKISKYKKYFEVYAPNEGNNKFWDFVKLFNYFFSKSELLASTEDGQSFAAIADVLEDDKASYFQEGQGALSSEKDKKDHLTLLGNLFSLVDSYTQLKEINNLGGVIKQNLITTQGKIKRLKLNTYFPN